MNKKYTESHVANILSYHKSGKSVLELEAEYGTPRSTIYRWIKEEQERLANAPPPLTQKQYRIMADKIARLEETIEILQTVDCTANDPLQERLHVIEELQSKYSVQRLCDALKVAKGTYYNHILRNKRDHAWFAKRREELREHIQRVYDDSNQIFGAGKIAAVLRNENIPVSERVVREIMRDMNLTSIREGAKKMYDKDNRKLKNHLNQQFHAQRPNEIWVSDVTCFRYNQTYYYICVIIDLFARTVVGCKIGMRNSTQLITATFKQAWEVRKPNAGLMLHTDRGSNYQSKAFAEYLESLQVIHSFSRAHIPYDNSVMESFFASMKREELYRTKYRSEKEFRTAVNNYIAFYNQERPHTKNKYETPAKKEQKFYDKQTTF